MYRNTTARVRQPANLYQHDGSRTTENLNIVASIHDYDLEKLLQLCRFTGILSAGISIVRRHIL